MSERTGFTVVELTLVLAVFAVLGTMSLVQGRRWMEAYDLRDAGVAFAAELSAARTQAIASNLTISIVVSEDRRRYGRSSWGRPPESWTELPRGVRFQTVPGRELRWFSRGNAAPSGTYQLASAAGALRVVVAPMGRVRWEWVK